jgi:hypothetical protein
MAEPSEGRVTKRKAHTKSRKGCFQCKQRHTKVSMCEQRAASSERHRLLKEWLCCTPPESLLIYENHANSCFLLIHPSVTKRDRAVGTASASTSTAHGRQYKTVTPTHQAPYQKSRLSPMVKAALSEPLKPWSPGAASIFRFPICV